MDLSEQTWPSNIVEYKVHTIRMADVEDPDLMVADPIYKWQQTEAGQYVMTNSVPEPMWKRSQDTNYCGHNYIIYAYFTPQQLTYYKLKFE